MIRKVPSSCFIGFRYREKKNVFLSNYYILYIWNILRIFKHHNQMYRNILKLSGATCKAFLGSRFRVVECQWLPAIYGILRRTIWRTLHQGDVDMMLKKNCLTDNRQRILYKIWDKGSKCILFNLESEPCNV